MTHDDDTQGAASDAAPSGEFPPPSAPLPVARELFRQFRSDDGMPTLAAWRGGWMKWTGTHWEEQDHAGLRSHVYRILEKVSYLDEAGLPVDWNPNRHKVANVMEAMAAVGHMRSTIDPPAWLDGAPMRSAIIACRNGLLHVENRTLSEHTPAFFNLVSVPFDYDPDAPEPRVWLDFLASVWPDDQASVDLLQEYTGYVLSGRTDMQKLLLLIGPTRSGKGTYTRMLKELIGANNACGPTLSSMSTNFGLEPLIGKPLAIIADARLGNGSAHTVVERLLSITGEDMLTIDKKFKTPWSGKLPTRFVILSNELPRFGDASGAIANRFLILQMTRSFLGKEDRTLDARLKPELPGILRWALDGLDRLYRNGRFTVPESSHDAATLMMDLASPISAFVRECCVRGPDVHVDPMALYVAWKAWSEDNGHRSGSASGFGRDLRAVVTELFISRPRINGNQVRRYERIALRDNWKDSLSTTLNAPSSDSSDSPEETPVQGMFPEGVSSDSPSDSHDSGADSDIEGESLDPVRESLGDPGKAQVAAGESLESLGSAFKGEVQENRPVAPTPLDMRRAQGGPAHRHRPRNRHRIAVGEPAGPTTVPPLGKVSKVSKEMSNPSSPTSSVSTDSTVSTLSTPT
ncbi:DNA primase family protein [Nocardia sp. alder85J]|uniref:DNA primase family protein n=1 Tax=Nocardia sp. alder85J TaxID=2862949 RepID=UPI001CD253BB|nr:phage/plasmid primase, P4 family [Nocardia sp. alder85J]MCX4095341.1 phage/plasmid primase, P4 family [Nocardia sp. alder85J]